MILEQTQSQLSSKQAEFDATPDTPENAEIRAALQTEINTLTQAVADLQALQSRIDALGDISILVDKLFQDNSGSLAQSDSWNPCAFCLDHINTNFGWIFQTLSKPTIDELEAIKVVLES